MIFRDAYIFQREARGKHRRRVFISQKCPMIDNLTTFIGKVITAHPSLALKVYKCKVLERFRNIEKAPSRNHFQDGAFCCGSERTFHGKTAAEEIGVRPIPVWWRWRDSNPRPLGCEPNALPAELQARIWINGVEQTRSTPLLYTLLQEMQVFYSTFGSLAITAAQRGHRASCSPTAFTLCSTFQHRPHLAP